MPLDIPNAHKKLPLGLEPEDFGQVGRCDKPDVFIISTLSSPLHLDTELNEYVLFVTSLLEIENIKWTVRFKAKSDEVEGSYDAKDYNDNFVFSLKFVDITEEGEIIVTATLTDVSGLQTVVSINHFVSSSDVVDYLSLDYISYAGNKRVTSRIVNDYYEYIHDAITEPNNLFGELTNIPESLIAAYISECFDSDYIEIETYSSDDCRAGVCRIYPDLVACIYKNPSDSDKENLLRFPKSNILLCGHLLSLIKNYFPGWDSLNSDSFIANEEAVIFVSQALYNASVPDYLERYSSLESVLSYLKLVKDLGSDSLVYLLEKLNQGKGINATMGSPWCRTFFFGKKKIRGGIYDENRAELHITRVRIDVFWEIDCISQKMLTDVRDEYTKEFRIRILVPQLRVFNQPNFSAASTAGNENIRLKHLQIFELIEIRETYDVTSGRIEWYRIRYQDVEKWIVAFSVSRFATFEKCVKLNFISQPYTDASGKFSFTVFNKGLYFIRAVKETRYNDGVKRDCREMGERKRNC